MSVHLNDATIVLTGSCPAEDAEAVLSHLLSVPNASIDWRACDHAHGAIIQLLAILPPAKLVGPPRGAFLNTHVVPALKVMRLRPPMGPA